MRPDTVRFGANGFGFVSGLFLRPSHPTACVVLAHGARAGMTHPFMATVASGLATLRYQFPFMENGRPFPDKPAVAHATVRAAVAAAAGLAPDLPLIAGGKSFGGRMMSQVQAEVPPPGIRGLVFLGFPLHLAKQPFADRGEHLPQVRIPMLFLQGTRDTLADMRLLLPPVLGLGTLATLVTADDADHAFHV